MKIKQKIRCMFGLETFPDSRWGRVAAVVWTAVLLLAASLGVGMLSLSFGPVKYGKEMFDSYFQVPGLVLLNVLPVILLTFLLWFVTGRAGLGFGITTAAVMTLTMVNILKIRLRNDPLMMEDLKLISEAGGVAGKYNLSLTQEQWRGIAIAVLLIAIVSALTHRFRMKRRQGWGKVRLAGCFVLLVVTGVLWKTVYLSEGIYNATINKCGINHYSNVDEFQSRGFVYPFLYSYKKSVDTPPEGYKKKEAAEILDSYEDADIPEEKKINVVSVMLEAYADLSKLVDNDAIDAVYEPLHEIESRSISGGLVSDVFMGNTVQTERAFLTGYNRMGSFRSLSNSYVRYLASQGYTTEGSHPGYDWFYNRANINENLGFEQYYFFDDYYSNTGMNKDTLILDSDALFFPEVVKMMQNSIEETGKPYFSFHVSYQNHGPYYTDHLFREGQEYVTPEDTGWSQESCTILNNYLGNIADTTEQLQKTLDALEEYDEPVVFVAFGDHLPWLGDDNSVYLETGMNISTDTEEGYLNHFTTPYFFWANSAAKDVLGSDFTGEGDTISPCFLMNDLFEALGWTGDAYMQYTRSVRETCPILSANLAYKIDGTFTRELTEDQQAVVDEFNCVQYYRRKNFEEYK
ncbi:sulfatase-like hydrolase/transferase [Butyricicoccus sp.]|uniref:LTA synthase family protein n=1 Tax=Butyricicoccus sp. TaxID=2049021 RepID=UPI003F15F6A7